MLYLIINNDFHVDNLLNHKETLGFFDVKVIRVPFQLKSDCKVLSNQVVTISSPYKNKKDFINPFKFKKAEQEVSLLNFKENDVVMFLSDYDLLTQYIVFKANNKGARVVFLEEGISLYSKDGAKLASLLCLKDLLKSFYIKYILGFSFCELYSQGTNTFLQLKDKYIDGLVIYRNVELNRDIKKYVINSQCEKILDLNQNVCLFINQPLYPIYLTKDRYLAIILESIKKIAPQFTTIHFKFHPRDSDEIKNEISQLLSKWKNVYVTSEQQPLLSLVKELKPKYAVSFFSDALFKLAESGLTMIFLFHFFSELNKHPTLMSLASTLDDIDYELPKDLQNLVNNHYVSVCESNVSLKQVIQDDSL